MNCLLLQMKKERSQGFESFERSCYADRMVRFFTIEPPYGFARRKSILAWRAARLACRSAAAALAALFGGTGRAGATGVAGFVFGQRSGRISMSTMTATVNTPATKATPPHVTRPCEYMLM